MEIVHQTYIGRFAPSPTGLLHIGSLFTAVASFLDARAHNGRWLVRIEDLDPQREINGAADAILRTLNVFGLEWDGEVVYQNQRYHYYQAALEQLQQQNLVYPCFCSRKMVQQHAVRMGMEGAVYGGICAALPLNRLPESNKLPAWRLRMPDTVIGFDDAIVGHYQQNLAHDIGDFILLRADGLWAYQLAVVVDDAVQGVTHIVRGQDLLVSAPRQIYLQQCLNFPALHYAHLPLLTNAQGQKWSKQTLAPIVNMHQRENLLRQVFTYLRLPEAPEVNHIEDLLLWAIQHWQIKNVPIGAINTEKCA